MHEKNPIKAEKLVRKEHRLGIFQIAFDYPIVWRSLAISALLQISRFQNITSFIGNGKVIKDKCKQVDVNVC